MYTEKGVTKMQDLHLNQSIFNDIDNQVAFDRELFNTLKEMFETAIKEKKEEILFVREGRRNIVIPNLTEEYVTSNKAPQELQDYYKFVVRPLFEERYFHPGENSEHDLFKRVAEHVGSNIYEIYIFYYMLRLRLFMPSSPTLMNAGRKEGTLSSCFVIIPEDNMRSIASYWKNMALVQKYGGGVGTDWSSIRPEGDPVNGTGGIASGFGSFLEVAQAINKGIKQGSARSGANASTMRYDHPQIMEFIDFKRDDPARFGFFNLSATFTDEDWLKCWNGEEIELTFDGKVYNTINGRDLIERMAENAWMTGDPSPYFLDRTNETWYELGIDKLKDPFGRIYGARWSHNPCGEQCLANWGVCNLGSINLFTLFNPTTGNINWYLFEKITRLATLFLDRVIDSNWFPNHKIEKQSRHLRNIGLGFMGLADVMYMMGIDYGSDASIQLTELISQKMTSLSKEVSLEMGEAFGIAPVLRGTEHKYRNTDFTCIAPTGSISLLSFCNNGVEPYFALGYDKLVYPKGEPDKEKHITIKPPAFMIYPDRKTPVTSHNIAPREHIDILAVTSKNVTNAVSKTVNLPNEATVEDILDLYQYGFEKGVKSLTVFRDGCRDDLALIVNEGNEIEIEKCCENENTIMEDGCEKCLECGWSACSV